MVSADTAPRLRRDAQHNIAKLRAAAIEVFQENGLGAPLEDIAARAGVSAGTLYNRFGSRTALIDSVVEELATERLARVYAASDSAPTPWDRFTTYADGLAELQAVCPAMADVLARRYSDAPRLAALCDQSYIHAQRLIDDAKSTGALRDDFSVDDLSLILQASASVGPARWRRHLLFVLDGIRSATR